MHNNHHQQKKWFVLVTKPRAEKQVGRQLADIGVDNFVPLKKTLRTWHDRKKWVEVPVFSRYIFVNTTLKLRNTAFEITNVYKYLFFANKICEVSPTEIESIKKLCSFEGDVIIEKINLKPGDEIEVIEGHFAGLKGIIEKSFKKNKISILFPSIGYQASVEFDKKIVRLKKG